MNESQDIKKDYATSFAIAIVIGVLGVIAGFMLTTGKGIDDPNFVNKFLIYSILGGGGLIFLMAVQLSNFITGERKLRVIIHDPEDGLLGSLKVVKEPLLLLLSSFVVFLLPMFYMAKFSNTFLSAIPFRSQQITVFANVYADSVFPALAENLFIFIPLSLIYTWNYKKFKKSNNVFFWTINLLLIPILFATLWRFFHYAVYGSSEVALLSTTIFGFLGILMTMVTMCFIPFSVFHFCTNLVLSLKYNELLSSDSILALFWIITIGLIVVIWLLSTFVYKNGKVKK